MIGIQKSKFELVRKYYIDDPLGDGRPLVEWQDPEANINGFNYTELEKKYYNHNRLNFHDSNIEFEDEPFVASFKWIDFTDLPPDYIVLQSRVKSRLEFSSGCLMEIQKYLTMNPKLVYISKLKVKWNLRLHIIKLNSAYTDYDDIINYERSYTSFDAVKKEKEIVEYWLQSLASAPQGLDFLFKSIISKKDVYKHITDKVERVLYFENQTGLSQIRKQYIL